MEIFCIKKALTSPGQRHVKKYVKYSEKIFYCISVQILVSSLFSVYPQHTVTDADMRLNVLRTVLLRL